MRAPRGRGIDGPLGQDVPVDHGREGDGAGNGVRGALPHDGRCSHEKGGRRAEEELRGRSRGVAGHLAQDRDVVRTPLARERARVHGLRRRALRDRAGEEALRRGNREKGGHRIAARGLAEDRDVVRVAAEPGDVLAHPGERCDLVAEAEVGLERALRRGELGEVEIAEGAEPVVEVHEDDLALAHQGLAEVRDLARRPRRVRAAVDEDHHGPSGAGLARGDHVQGEAVLRHRDSRETGDLMGDGTEGRGIPNAVPGLHRLRRPQTQVAGGRRRIGNRAPVVQAVELDAADAAAGDVDLETGVKGDTHLLRLRPRTERSLGAR